MEKKHKSIETVKAPQAIGPYSQAIKIEANQSLIFVSGQLPVDPETGKLIEGDIETLTVKVLDNIEAILIEAGSSLKQVVRTDVFLKSLNTDFKGMNTVYAKRFNTSPMPARQTVEVSNLPMNASIEISCIAIGSNQAC